MHLVHDHKGSILVAQAADAGVISLRGDGNPQGGRDGFEQDRSRMLVNGFLQRLKVAEGYLMEARRERGERALVLLIPFPRLGELAQGDDILPTRPARPVSW